MLRNHLPASESPGELRPDVPETSTNVLRTWIIMVVEKPALAKEMVAPWLLWDGKGQHRCFMAQV